MSQVSNRPRGSVVPIRPDVRHPVRRDARSRPRRVRRGASGRLLASAGHVLGVGLVCFALWLVLDAQQLVDHAERGAGGARRTAALAVLRPVASLERHLGLDGLVGSAERALGHTTSAPPARRRASGGARSGPQRRVGLAVTTTTTPSAPAFAQPSAAHPVTVLDIGDSLGEDLGIGLDDLLGSDPAVHLVDTAQANTGLADPAYYDWPANLARQLQRYHPAIVVVMLGGNDWQPFLTGPNTAAEPGTAYWQRAYGARVAQLIDEATASGAKVFWEGLPPMGAQSGLSAAMAPGLDAVYEAEARTNGATYVSTWAAFTDAEGGYAAALPDASGQVVAVRDPDGVHLATAGCALAASLVVQAIDSTLHISL